MGSLINKFIENSPFAAVLWQLREVNGIQDFYMEAYNSHADNFDRRNFSLFLNQPFRLCFPEAPQLRDAFFTAIETKESISIAEFKHHALRKVENVFRIWIVPLDDNHVIILYENISEVNKSKSISEN